MQDFLSRHFKGIAWLAIFFCALSSFPLILYAQSDTPVTHTEVVPILLAVVGALLAALCSLFGGIVSSKANMAVANAAEAMKCVRRMEMILTRHGIKLLHIESMLTKGEHK